MLVLAWGLGQVVKDVQTAEYLAGALETGISAFMLPALVSVRFIFFVRFGNTRSRTSAL